jgi:transcriptional regulator with XRE-family HTH domain
MRLRLREWRERRGYSIRGLAERAGVGFATVHRIETGHASPTVEMLERLASALDIDVRDFLPPPKRGSRKRGG